MGDEEATRVCGRCKKAVAEANFALHESHCRRFLVLCPDCEENVPRSELQSHREEQHALVRCPKCRKKMEKRLLAEHEEEQCPARVEPCVFCELEMPWSELQEHSVACGSRTERCLDCGRYVRMSEREEHGSTCPARDLYSEEDTPTQGAHGPLKIEPRNTKVYCKVCKALFPAEEIKKHEMRCTAAAKWINDDSDSDSDLNLYENVSGMDLLSPRLRNLLQDPGSDEDQTPDPELGLCPHCQLILPQNTLLWHEGKCKLHRNLRHREGAATNYV